MIGVTNPLNSIPASIDPPWRRHARWMLIACCALGLVFSSFSLSLISGSVWVKMLQLFPLAIYALLITGEVAKLNHPLARDLTRYPKRFFIPPRLLDGAPLSSSLTVFAILSLLLGIGLGIHLIRADKAMAIAKLNFAAQIAAARDKAASDSRIVTQYISAHSPTPAELATAMRLNSRSTAAIQTASRLSALQIGPNDILTRLCFGTFRQFRANQLAAASADVRIDLAQASDYIRDHLNHPTSAEQATIARLLAASTASTAAYARIVALRPAPNSILNSAWLLGLTAVLPILWLMRWRWLWQWKTWCRENNRCADCGYDLRASIDRCPECGARVPTGGGVQTSYARLCLKTQWPHDSTESAQMLEATARAGS